MHHLTIPRQCLSLGFQCDVSAMRGVDDALSSRDRTNELPPCDEAAELTARRQTPPLSKQLSQRRCAAAAAATICPSPCLKCRNGLTHTAAVAVIIVVVRARVSSGGRLHARCAMQMSCAIRSELWSRSSTFRLNALSEGVWSEESGESGSHQCAQCQIICQWHTSRTSRNTEVDDVVVL